MNGDLLTVEGDRRDEGRHRFGPAQLLSGEFLRFGFGALAGAALVGAALASGAVHAVYVSLATMGFDPDRAQFIRAAMFAASVSLFSGVCGGQRRSAVLFGMVTGAAMYGPTFVTETQSALSSTGAAGVFDPTGWLLTLVTVAFSATAVSWGAGILAATVRPSMVEACLAAAALVRGRRIGAAKLIVVARVVLIIGLLLITIPILGDILTYSPDSHMLQAPQMPDRVVPSPVSVGSAGPNASAQPWEAWRPAGHGRVDEYTISAPWGDPGTTTSVEVYTPPGYDADASRRYPTLYEVPWSASAWKAALDAPAFFDVLIDQGTMPSTIVVFADASGGPYPDSQCADSFDGREWYDRWFGQTLVPWIDGTFRTIATGNARAVMGMSEGGYCAAILTLHHADLIGAAISFSGYFHAGLAGATSLLPFGDQPTLMDNASPDVYSSRCPNEVRSRLFFILVARPTQELFGRQAVGFDALLASQGYSQLLIDTSQPHGWAQVRQELGRTMAVWSDRMVGQSVFQTA